MERLKVILAVFILIITGLFIYVLPHNRNQTKENPPVIDKNQNETDKSNNIYFPITKFHERITYRTFGTIISIEDKAPTCGRPFSGYHNADDLEIFPEETEIDVPVFATTEGEIVENSYVDGYGGLIIEKVILNNQEYTINYGHIKLNGIGLNVGDRVTAGQKIAILGKGCSIETSGERKHLHFAIHNGGSIDVRGYLSSREELENWENPRDFLTSLKAKEPKQ